MTFFFRMLEFCHFSVTPKYHKFVWYIFPCQIYIFHTFRSITMFLKVLNKVNFKCLHKPKLFLITDLLPFARLLDLLAINHSSSERRIFLDYWSPPMFWLFYNLHGCALPHKYIFRSGLAPFPECQGSCSIVWSQFGSCSRFVCFLQYTSGIEVSACSLDTNLNYVTTMV